MFSERLEFYPLLVDAGDPVLQVVTPGLQFDLSRVKHFSTFPDRFRRMDVFDQGVNDPVRDLFSLELLRIDRNHDLGKPDLISDLHGDTDALQIILDAKPTVLAHNVETVCDLYNQVRIGADYTRTLTLLENVKKLSPGMLTKSGFMVGLGETPAQITRLLKDLRSAGVDLLTIGQYLAPSAKHYPVKRYPEPAEYQAWKDEALSLGFKAVASGPLVRSSYRAGTLYRQALLAQKRSRNV